MRSELAHRLYVRLTETSNELWPSEPERWGVAHEVAGTYPEKQGLGEWTVESSMQVDSDPGQAFKERRGFVVQRTDDHVYWVSSEKKAEAMA